MKYKAENFQAVLPAQGTDPEQVAFHVRQSMAPYNVMQSLYAVQYEAYHPDDGEKTFVYANCAPGVRVCAALTREEARPIVSGRPIHQHSYYELLYVVEGELYQVIESARHKYTAGSLCLLNLNVRHREEFSGAFRVVFLCLSAAFLEDLLRPDQMRLFPEEENLEETKISRFLHRYADSAAEDEKAYLDFIPREEDPENLDRMRRMIRGVYTCTARPDAGSTFLIKFLFARIFALLDDGARYQTNPIRLGTQAEAQLFSQISKLMERTHGRTSRSQLEDALHYSGDYLNKIVNKYSGMNIFRFGMSYCMREAARMLEDDARSITRIAETLGFRNRTHFYKVFREYFGMTPGAYRALRTGKPDAGPERDSGRGAGGLPGDPAEDRAEVTL